MQMLLRVDLLDDLETEEAGGAVHAQLRAEGRTIAIDGKRVVVSPMPKRDHPCRNWLYELAVYVRLRCGRCSATDAPKGLLRAVWGEWLCSGCANDLGRLGGELDRRGWPNPERSAA